MAIKQISVKYTCAFSNSHKAVLLYLRALVLGICMLVLPCQVMADDLYHLALSKTDSASSFPLSLNQFIDLVVERNQQIQLQAAELEIKKAAVHAAEGIYEPALVGGATFQYSNEQNDSAQFASRGFKETYEQEADSYKLEIEGLVPTGAQLKLGWALNEKKDDISAIGTQYRQLAYLNLTQPLLKNAGIETTNTQIRIAERDVDVAVQGYRQELLNEIGRATVAYWDLFLSQEKLAMRRESVQVAEKILDDNRVRFKTGKMAEIEVLEAEAGVATRRALEVEARKSHVAAMNDVLSLFAEHAVAYRFAIEATEPLTLEERHGVYQDSIGKAFSLRPEYLASHSKLTQEQIRLSYAENQLWPELDLKASYALNGLDMDWSGSWERMADNDYYSWSVGLEFRVPLMGNRKGAGELAQVKERKRKALLEMKMIEVLLANKVDTAIRNIDSSTEQASYSKSVAEFNRRLLDIELVRLSAGKSNSRMVLEKEEDYRSAREAELEALVDQKKAILELEMAEGSLLSRYRKDVSKEGI